MTEKRKMLGEDRLAQQCLDAWNRGVEYLHSKGRLDFPVANAAGRDVDPFEVLRIERLYASTVDRLLAILGSTVESPKDFEGIAVFFISKRGPFARYTEAPTLGRFLRQSARRQQTISFLAGDQS